MALIEYTLDGKINKVDKAIERIKTYAPISEQITGKPFYVAYSGGKDSDVIRILCQLADIKHELVHNHTTVDAPETVHYIRSIPNVIISKPDITMWDLIVKKKLPPLRNARYCCSELKERGGKDRFVITGVRWQESIQRSTRGSLEIQGSSKKTALILNSDNDEHRREFETCLKQGKRILNPIIDWELCDVWEFLNYYGCKSNPLYQNNYERVGCVGCPLGRKSRIKEFKDYPKYKNIYINTFDRMLKTNVDIPYTWKSGAEVYKWWLSEKPVPKQIEGQLNLYEWGNNL